ncbi:hypothetical protein ACIQW5_28865 [Methylorubrum thiocyanatum]|uniref:hypothetical protein n=1 Tax=Methylorubrum thiocyanatum TaxID=47958 RepID=UPI00383AE7AC
MARDAYFAAMFDGPSPTARRIDGMRDARSGKPKLSNDRDYLAGYDIGQRREPRDGERRHGPRAEGGTR